MGNVEVNTIDPDQWRVYREIRLAALADSPQAFESALARELALTEADWRGRLTRSRTFLGSVDGVASATAAGIPSPEHAGDTEVVGVWTHPDARRLGLGSRVVGAVLDGAATRVWLWVAEDNSPARSLYLRLGFQRTGERKPLPSDPSRVEIGMVLDRR